MIPRYQTEAMKKVWSEQNKYQAWLEVEQNAALGFSKLGLIPADEAQKIKDNAKFDTEEIKKLEEITHHDVVAFTRNVSESLGDERKWVHYGLTSTDVVDTANGYLLKQANDLIREDLAKLLDVVGSMALKYKDTVQMGRTHGVHAEPTTFGLKLLNWYSELKRDTKRFDEAAKGVEAGKISGAVGSFANVPMEVETFVTDALGIRAQEVSTQVLPRDLHAEYIAQIALIGTSLERFSVELRHLQRTEVREVEEFFAKGQKGSSAMPHKRNPISAENISGLARVLRGYLTPAYEDVILWHERDISHSSVERIILPDATSLIDYMLNRFTTIMENLHVFEDRMKDNLDVTHGLIYSQRILLKLVDAGLSREEAYDLVQPKTATAWDEQRSFKKLIEEDSRITSLLSQSEIDDAFDYSYHLRNIDKIFERVGLTE